MAFKLPENVQETTTTTGTVTVTLAGAVSGNYPFSSQMSNGDTTFYAMLDTVDIEVGIGTYSNTSGQQLSRDTVIYSTNGNAKVNWGAGTRNVIVGLPGAALASLLVPDASNGLLAQTAERTYARRTLTAGGSNLSVNDGDGVAGNPTIMLSQGAGSGLDADTLDGVEGSGYQLDLAVPGDPEVDAGTATDERVWTAAKVKRAVDQHAPASNVKLAGDVVQLVRTEQSSRVAGSTTQMLYTSRPTTSSGSQFLSASITPVTAGNLLCIEVNAQLEVNNASRVQGAIFKTAGTGSSANAIFAKTLYHGTTVWAAGSATMRIYVTAVAGSQTFTFRAGSELSSAVHMNSASAAAIFGGYAISTMTITEIKV